MTTDLESRLAGTMQAVAESTRIPTVPRRATARKPLRGRFGRWVVAVIAAGGIAVIGLGAAAAGGVFSPGAERTFGGWQNINPQDAFLVAQLPGPYGTEIDVYQARDHRHAETCIGFLLRHDPAFRSSKGALGGACADWSAHDREFGQSGGGLRHIEFPGKEDFSISAWSAGTAVSGDLIYAGKSHPVAAGNGYLLAWARDSDWRTATLIGRDANGNEVGEIRNLGAPQPQVIHPAD
jgi:hypothetical protein